MGEKHIKLRSKKIRIIILRNLCTPNALKSHWQNLSICGACVDHHFQNVAKGSEQVQEGNYMYNEEIQSSL